jgi:hypothetical protein
MTIEDVVEEEELKQCFVSVVAVTGENDLPNILQSLDLTLVFESTASPTFTTTSAAHVEEIGDLLMHHWSHDTLNLY